MIIKILEEKVIGLATVMIRSVMLHISYTLRSVIKIKDVLSSVTGNDIYVTCGLKINAAIALYTHTH